MWRREGGTISEGWEENADMSSRFGVLLLLQYGGSCGTEKRERGILARRNRK